MAATVSRYPVQCYVPCPKCSDLHIEVELAAENSEVFCSTRKVNVNVSNYWAVLSQGQ